MTDIIIPIKDLSLAKMRLACVLTPSQRAEFVLAMLEDLLNIVSRLDRGQILVVGTNDAVFDVARKFAATPVRENRAKGYNSAVALGFAALPEYRNVAVLPGDVPLASEEEIASLIAPSKHNVPTIRLAPSHDCQGTNGLFLAAKNLIAPGFGLDSFNRYMNTIRKIGIEPEVLDAPCLSHDIDTPQDLCDVASLCTQGATGKFLHSVGVPLFNQIPKERTA